MRDRSLLIFLLLLIATGLVNGQVKTVTYVSDPSSTPPDLVIALHHVGGSLAFIPEENLVKGKVTITFTPNRYRTDSMVFNTPGFTMHSLELSGKPCRYTQDGGNLVVYPPAQLARGTEYELAFNYESRPMAGPIYFVGWRPDETGKRKQIWAHRPNGWLPYMDGRVTMDLEITFDKHYTVFTNGERAGVKENQDGTKTWHYRMAKNHPYFSTALAIGDYEYQSSKTDRGIPLEFLYYQGEAGKVQPTYQYTEQMFTFFEKEMGVPYPYPVYREIPVIDYMYGGMECTTSTIFGDYMLIDPRAYWQRNYINVNAHELAHQWYGDCIAHLVNRDVWLTESFGTYFAKIFEKSIFGEDQYEAEMNYELLQALAASKQNNYPVGGSQGGVARIYQKGSLVLGMLRYVMGDREFRDAIKAYTERYLFSYVQTSDFVRIVYDVTGKSYNWFFDEWILRGGEPEYKVGYTVAQDTSGHRSTVFSVSQVQEVNDLVGLFRMPVVFEVGYSDGTKDSVQVWVEKKDQVVSVPNPGNKHIDFCLFDPGRCVLKKVTFPKELNELSSQALKASHMIDRYDALLALREFPVDQKREVLLQCWSREKFYLPRTEIIQQLSNDSTPETFALILDAVKSPDANVRKAALLNIDPVPDMLREAFENLLADSSYLNVELALDVLCRSFPAEKDRYLAQLKDAWGWRGLNIRMKWLEISIGSGRTELLPELIAYTGPEYEFETRINSLQVLKRLDYMDPVVAKNAISASQHWNNKLATAGKEVLTYFSQQDKYKNLILTP